MRVKARHRVRDTERRRHRVRDTERLRVRVRFKVKS